MTTIPTVAERIHVNRGTRLKFEWNWKTPTVPPANANLSGFTVNLMDVSPELAGLASVSLVDAPTGLIRVIVNWNEALVNTEKYYIRVQVTDGTDPVGSNLFQLVYQ